MKVGDLVRYSEMKMRPVKNRFIKEPHLEKRMVYLKEYEAMERRRGYITAVIDREFIVDWDNGTSTRLLSWMVTGNDLGDYSELVKRTIADIKYLMLQLADEVKRAKYKGVL